MDVTEEMQAGQATPSWELEMQMLNPNFAKSEREWWAAHEIERLRARVAELEATVNEWAGV